MNIRDFLVYLTAWKKKLRKAIDFFCHHQCLLTHLNETKSDKEKHYDECSSSWSSLRAHLWVRMIGCQFYKFLRICKNVTNEIWIIFWMIFFIYVSLLTLSTSLVKGLFAFQLHHFLWSWGRGGRRSWKVRTLHARGRVLFVDPVWLLFITVGSAGSGVDQSKGRLGPVSLCLRKRSRCYKRENKVFFLNWPTL